MRRRPAVLVVLLIAPITAGQSSFVNFETPHVSPLAMTPDGNRLLAVNTPDNRLEVFDASGSVPVRLGSMRVGLDPVSVRARTNSEAWVINHISDSISIVDLDAMTIIATIDTDDEPTDVVFAGDPLRAFVSCSQVNRVLVYDLADLSAEPDVVEIFAEDPRAMAVSPDGLTVYVAIFESGNGTTILGGGSTIANGFPPNVVGVAQNPYGGENPPPNDGAGFNPPFNEFLPAPPAVGLIVRKDSQGNWLDDNGADWTDFVSGELSFVSGRPEGWDLVDHDVVVIDTQTLAVSYAGGAVNIGMQLAVNPVTGEVTVIGTDATNEIRFEPVISSTFVRVNMGTVEPVGLTTAVADLNPHLDYGTKLVDQSQRDLSIGDPRGIVWSSAGTVGYVTGMGSNNVIAIDPQGNRVGASSTIEVGEGPTGIVLDETNSRLFVLNKFDASVSMIDTGLEAEVLRVPLFDPSPAAIRLGRKHLYDTHKTSGLGQTSCASCHVDARMDRLAWDLGDPSGEMKLFNQNCNLGAGDLLGFDDCEDWHPMKGPMTTQTLQDIIGKEPHHWRGDRDGIEEFNGAFVGLLGDDAQLTAQEMQEFEDFLATIHFPPNPFRNFNNSLPTDLPLPGHYANEHIGIEGEPLPNGNAVSGLNLFRTGGLDQGIDCVTCHTLPTGAGSNYALTGFTPQPQPPGPNGEMHLGIVSVDGSTNVSMKIPQFRNAYEKVGFELTQLVNTAGFGYLHDGSIDSLTRFITEPVFNSITLQQAADLVAFMLAISGSNLPMGSPSDIFELPGPLSNDAHAAVGAQVTFDQLNVNDAALLDLLAQMETLATGEKVGLVAHGLIDGEHRGYEYLGGGQLQSDRAAQAVVVGDLLDAAANGAVVSFTVVPMGSQMRVGIDQDEDGHFDRDELDACMDPANAASFPGAVLVGGDGDADGDVDLDDYVGLLTCLAGPGGASSDACVCTFDLTGDGAVSLSDVAEFAAVFMAE